MTTFVTDGGIETDLIRRGAELPHFAAFPLLQNDEGRALLRDYYAGYAAIASAGGRSLMLESPTWRASPDWGRLLSYSVEDLDQVNRTAITFMAELRREYLDTVGIIRISGSIGPRYDETTTDFAPESDDARAYHQPQLAAFAAAGADIASAYTLTHVGEAIGIVRAARAVDLPIAVSFTLDADGRLLSGMSLGDAIIEVDAAAAPDYFLVNCAHPSHIAIAVFEPGEWTRRIAGTRANAAAAGHAELDEAIARGDGTPAEFASAHRELMDRLPHLTILGGCCGTDERHVAALHGKD